MMDRSQHPSSTQHRQTVHEMINNGARQQQYSSTGRPGHGQTQDALFGLSSDLIGAHGWVPRRRMPENVTPAAPLSQQMNVSGHMTPGVPLHHHLPSALEWNYGLMNHININVLNSRNSAHFYSSRDPSLHHHHNPHDTENFGDALFGDRMGEAKQKGLSKSEIEKISCYKYKGSPKSDLEQVTCIICISEFELKQTLRVLPCSHEYHAKCIDKWLKSNRSCPICRQDASTYFSNNKKPRLAKAT
jgi:E3 ubiquitin-protein ligase RNF38/44